MTTTEARSIGRNAFLAGEPCVPAINAQIMEAIADMPVGGGALPIMKAFVSGWTAANLAAAW